MVSIRDVHSSGMKYTIAGERISSTRPIEIFDLLRHQNTENIAAIDSSAPRE